MYLLLMCLLSIGYSSCSSIDLGRSRVSLEGCYIYSFLNFVNTVSGKYRDGQSIYNAKISEVTTRFHVVRDMSGRKNISDNRPMLPWAIPTRAMPALITRKKSRKMVVKERGALQALKYEPLGEQEAQGDKMPAKLVAGKRNTERYFKARSTSAYICG